MRKMRVLHICGLYGGGIETIVQLLCRELANAFDFAVFSAGTGRSYPAGTFPRDETGVRPAGALQLLVSLNRLVRSWRPDVVHCHSQSALSLCTMALGLGRVKPATIMHWHGTIFRRSRTPWGQWIADRSLARAAAVIACSEAVAAAGIAHHGVPEGRVHVIHNAVEIARFDAARPHPRLRALLGATEETVLALFVGRLGAWTKGLDVLAEAMARIPADLPLALALVGPGDDAAVRPLFAQCSHPVSFLGARSHQEVPALLKAADILVQPSRHEGLPLTLIEAMAAGLPVIATRVGGIPEAVHDGVTGLLIEPGDPQPLALSLQRLALDGDMRKRLGEAGQRRARQIFDVGAVAQRVAEVYEAAATSARAQ